MPRRRLPAEAYIEGVRANDRATLARAITVVESAHPDDAALAATILDALLPLTGNSRRIGITGVPGAGKSTFIDRLGMQLIHERNETVAVLSVDPSSPISGGSILGDKTRMEKLAAEDAAFIRPSPSSGHLGGVAPRTREVMLLCEAAGYRNILIETVGVGQSETAVRSMTDFFLLLMLPGAGDELQGIKRGILEMADALAINKADGDNLERARRAHSDYVSALHLFPPSPDGWSPPVLLCSALTGDGVAEVWQKILDHHAHLETTGRFESRRAEQSLAWLRELVRLGLDDNFRRAVASTPRYEQLVREGRTTPLAAARQLLDEFNRNQA